MNVQPPHSIQSIMFASIASSRFAFCTPCTIFNGISPIGHASIQRAHFMQGYSFVKAVFSSTRARIPEVPFITEISAEYCAIPIMGPPLIILVHPSTNPPHCSMTSLKGVPILTSKLPGFLTPLPVTVTTLSIRGTP